MVTSRYPPAAGHMSAAGASTPIVVLAVGLIALHVVDDSFVQPQPGTSATDHLVSGYRAGPSTIRIGNMPFRSGGPPTGQPSQRSTMRVVTLGSSLLRRIARQHDVDGLTVLARIRTGESVRNEPEQAFALLRFGERMYRPMAHAEYFPAVTRKARRRGARIVERSLSSRSSHYGERAVIYMAHCVPTYSFAFWQCMARKGEVDVASAYEERHREQLALLDRYYPLDSEEQRSLDAARREVDVFATRVPIAVPELAGAATGYGRALEKGVNPTPIRISWTATRTSLYTSFVLAPRMTQFA